MSNLQKTLIFISIISISILCYFLFFIKYDRYGSCSINSINDVKYLMLDVNSYKKLENKKNVIIHNKNSNYEIRTKNTWSFINESSIWISPIELNKDIINGQYMIYLTKETIWSI